MTLSYLDIAILQLKMIIILKFQSGILQQSFRSSVRPPYLTREHQVLET